MSKLNISGRSRGLRGRRRRRPFVAAVFFAWALSAASVGVGADLPPFLEREGLVVLEAESFHDSRVSSPHEWIVVADGAAAGGAALEAVPDTDRREDTAFVERAPRVSWNVEFASSGLFHVWTRLWAPSTRSDSAHIGLDGQEQASGDRLTAPSVGVWVWTRETMDGASASLRVDAPGLHSVDLWMREDGVRVDRIVLTSDASWTPSGIGPPESPRVHVNEPPTVEWRSPAPGARVELGTPVRVEVAASDRDGRVARVDLRVDGRVVATSWSSPWVFAWTPALVGARTLLATAQDDDGASTATEELIVEVVEPQPEQPSEGLFVEGAGPIVLEAEGATRTIERLGIAWAPTTSVAGFGGSGAMIATPDRDVRRDTDYASLSPELSWDVDFAAGGTFHVWLRIWAPSDRSDSAHVGVDGLESPDADGITAGIVGAWTWTRDTMDGVTATLDVASAGPRAVSVWMREDGVIVDRLLLTRDDSYVPTGVGPAATPMAGDDPRPPTVRISEPLAGSQITEGAGTWISADASDPDDDLVSVEFRVEGVRLAIDSASPYRVLWVPTGTGPRRIEAIARDETGVATVSEEVHVEVVASPETPDSGGGSDEDPWLESSGRVVIEAEEWTRRVDREGQSWISTTEPGGFVGASAVEASPNRGVHFDSGFATRSPELRYPVEFESTGVYVVWLRVFAPSSLDDSAHVGLDGSDQGTARRMTAGAWNRWVWTAALMDGGVATLAVDEPGVHELSLWQREDGLIVDRILLSLDAGFVPTGTGPAASLRRATGGGETTPNQAPTVTLSSPAASTSWIEGEVVDLVATASDADGLVTRVDFFVDGAPIGSATRIPFAVSWTASGLGERTLSAIARDDDGATASSAPVRVLVEEAEPDPPPDPEGTGAFLESSGLLVFEAEDWTRRVDRDGQSWELVAAPAGYSGAGAVESSPNRDSRYDSGYSSRAPELAWSVRVDAPGVFRVWLRVWAPDTRSDSVHVGLDGLELATSDRIEAGSFETWVWTSATMDGVAATMEFRTAGVHEVQLWQREDGLIVDKIVLARDGSFRPTGLGPAESARDGSAPNTEPGVEIVSPADGATFAVGESIVLEASAFDADGGIARVEFWEGGRWIGVDDRPPYRIHLVPEETGGPRPRSPVIRGVSWAPASSIVRRALGNDSWPVTWTSDDRLFSSFADGRGFEPGVSQKLSMGFARVSGTPTDPQGVNVRSASGEATGDGPVGRKASGLVAIDGTLYLWVRNVDGGGEESELCWSFDNGSTWTRASWRFADLGFCSFVNYGRDYAGARDGYVYVVSHDHPSAYEAADRFVLARAPARHDAIVRRDSWTFWEGISSTGEPLWAPVDATARRAAVFSHAGRCRRSAVSYNAAVGRYLWWQQDSAEADSRFSGGFGVYDAPEPWGPWTQVYRTSSWDVGPGERGEFPTKWMSADGNRVHLLFSGDDAFSVRRADLTIDRSFDTVPFEAYDSPGEYTFTAWAVDQRGARVASREVTIRIDSPLAGSGALFVESGGRVVIEAESFADSTAPQGHRWIADTSVAGFAGTAAMLATPDTDVRIDGAIETTSPSLRYRALFSRTATYYVWLRMYASSNRGDSAHFGIDGRAPSSAQQISGDRVGAWHWAARRMSGERATVVISTSGEHELDLWMREDGTRVDRIVLTTDASFVPSGSGPAVSAEQRALLAVRREPSAPLPAPVAESSAESGLSMSASGPSSDVLDASSPVLSSSLERRVAQSPQARAESVAESRAPRARAVVVRGRVTRGRALASAPSAALGGVPRADAAAPVLEDDASPSRARRLGEESFVRGDVDGDGTCGVTDLARLGAVLDGRDIIDCADAADLDDDGRLTTGDLVRLARLIVDGVPPAQPWPLAGADTTDDSLGCERGASEPRDDPTSPQE